LELTMAASSSLLFWNGAGLVLAISAAAEYADRPGRWVDPVIDAAVVVGVPVLLGLVIRTTQELHRQADAKAATQRQQRDWESRAARAEERSAIARELHDVVAHHIASMVLRLSIARHVLSDAEPRVVEVLDDVHHTGAAALAELCTLLEIETVRPSTGPTQSPVNAAKSGGHRSIGGGYG
jgi:signal transduction histidine kinase